MKAVKVQPYNGPNRSHRYLLEDIEEVKEDLEEEKVREKCPKRLLIAESLSEDEGEEQIR